MPQTYPIQTVPSAPLTTFILASELGLALNCDLLTGLDKTTGLVAADDGPAIMVAMSGATAHNPICLLMDGSSAVSGLRLPVGGHWSIQGFGRDTGFFACAGTNNCVIQNGTQKSSQPAGRPAPARGANVTIRDLFINGNRGDGTHGNSSTGDGRGDQPSPTMNWYFNIYLTSLDHVLIENVQSYNSPAFQCVIDNCGFWVVDKCHFQERLLTDDAWVDNSDGVHVNGPSNDGRISNCYFRAGDDPIALNAPEGYGGLITRITITNCVSFNSMTMMRIYTGSVPSAGGGATPMVDGVTVTNYQGSSFDYGLIVGNGACGSIPDSITNVTFTNCKFTSPLFAEISDSVGTMTFDSCDWIGGTDTCMFFGWFSTTKVSMLKITNCQAIRTPAGSGIQAMLGTHSFSTLGPGSIAWNRVIVNGFSVVDIGGYSGAAIPSLLSLTGGATMGHLQLDAVDASNIAGLLGAGTISPAVIAGGGVLQTGWQIPDAIMANNTPYLSSNAGGAASMKVNGAAKRFSLV